MANSRGWRYPENFRRIAVERFECCENIKPDGEFHMLDFEGPDNGAHGFLARILHSSDGLKDNSADQVLSLMTEAGFADPKKVGHCSMRLAHIAYYRAIT